MEFIRAYPILGASDYESAVAFYRDVLGFIVSWQWGTPPSRVGVSRGGVELQLVCDARLRGPKGARVYIHMTGIDAYYQEVCARGAKIYEPLTQRDWGMKDFRVLDPYENLLGFAEKA